MSDIQEPVQTERMADQGSESSPMSKLEAYPPFQSMGIRILSLVDNWRRVRILLPLAEQNRNPGGSMFGGCIASLADPIPALVCHRQFPAYAVWTRELQVDFRRPGLSDLELRFELQQAEIDAIAKDLARRGRSTPGFEFGFYDRDDKLVAWIKNRVAIRPQDRYSDSAGALRTGPRN